jgi:hypothetical protein
MRVIFMVYDLHVVKLYECIEIEDKKNLAA